MNPLRTEIDPATTIRLLSNLDLAIDEAKMVREAVNHCDQIWKIESASGPSKRTQFLRQEVARLEAQIVLVRSQAREGRISTPETSGPI